ncbi:hypothetical protein EJB05_00407, partial [Eragrostis curvula]
MASPTEEPPLPDEILEDIFLRLDEAADLARASAACTSFRRLVCARPFLRRFRSLHPPPILGCLETEDLASEDPLFHPVDPPNRSAAASAALAQAADFTFSFTNHCKWWHVRDVRDSRVLLAKRYFASQCFEYLLVCDPLHRRYATVPAIPADLRPDSSSPRRGLRPCAVEFEPFLDAVSEKDEEEEDLPFRVICNCNVRYESKWIALVFSSVTGKWQAATTFEYKYRSLFGRYYARNCFYWTHSDRNSMLMLDPCEMKFSVIAVPPSIHRDGDRAIVDVGENKIGLVTYGSEKLSLELFSTTMRNNSVNIEEWQHDKTIPLELFSTTMPDYDQSICGAASGCLVMRCIEKDWYKIPKDPESHFFVVDLKTLLVERLYRFVGSHRSVFPYASFPPPLSPPSMKRYELFSFYFAVLYRWYAVP